ncbi:MAG: hypothetical protein IT463_00610, partial [Planctomycetes bacterium]|nr:hypothetical protein [Planctomycetota bacterium]
MNVLMRVAALATPALLALICHVPPARAQGKLTPAQEAWLSLLQSAPFTDPARANGCRISALNAAVFSEHLLPVLANASSLSAEQRSRLEAIVRIEVDAPG